MGAGHAYSIDKHMLVDPIDLTDYSRQLDFADEWQDEPLEVQLQALEKTDLLFPEGEDILDDMKLVEIERNGSVYHSLDIKGWVDKYYSVGAEVRGPDDGMKDFINPVQEAIEDLKSQIVENAAEASRGLDFVESFGAYKAEESEGNMIVLGDGEINPEGFSNVKMKAAMLADNYNTGVVVYMEDMQGQAYLEGLDDDDLLTLVTADYAYQVDFGDIMAVKGSLDPEVVDAFFARMEESMEDAELESVLGDKVEVFHDYAEDLDIDDLDVDANDPVIREELAKEIIGRLEGAMNEVSDTFEQFADKTMDGLINSFKDKTFRFALNAWTSAPYERGKTIFSGPVKSPEMSQSPSP